MNKLGIDKMVILGKDYGKLGGRLQSNLPDEKVANAVQNRYPDFSLQIWKRFAESSIVLAKHLHKTGV